MLKFTRARDALLIELVKGHKILYDASDENFKNNILKHKSWEEISAIIGIPVPECKKRWKSLRDQYNKKKKGDMTLPALSTWDYMDLMSFLSDTVVRRESIPKEGHMEQMVIEIIEEQDTDNDEKSETVTDDQNKQPITVSLEDPLKTEETSVDIRKQRILKRKLSEQNAKIMAKRRQKSALFEKITNKAPDIKTPTQKFFESMGDIVDKLPMHLQAEVRLRVCQIVTEAEIKHHIQHAQHQNLQPQSYNAFRNTAEYFNP